MTKPKIIRTLALVCGLALAQACTTKNEIPQPVEDTARVDALRAQLLTLQQQVFGVQQSAAADSLSLAQLQALIAQLQANLQRTVAFSVMVKSFLLQPLAGATVVVSQGGKIVSATTSANGIATFNNLYAGVITATVDLTGFARLVLRADIRNTADDAPAYSTTSQVLMLPLGGTSQADSCMTTPYWKLYANYSMVDDTLGGALVQGQGYFGGKPSNPSFALPAGPNVYAPSTSYSPVTTQTVAAYMNQYSFLGPIGGNNSYNSLAVQAGFTGWDAPTTGITGNGQVVAVSYENAKWTATLNANGIFKIKLPASDISAGFNGDTNAGNIFGFIIEFGEFNADFTQYTTPQLPYIPGYNPNNQINYPPQPTYTSTYVYRVTDPGGWQWTSHQSTTLTSAWPFFYYGSLK